jgi:tRNA threonylcarbamoyladenosine biosynthesis protein TsaE
VSDSLDLLAASPDDTRAIGEAVGALLEPGDVVSLTGDLGAGKTTFVQGAAAALGVVQPVLSPTFTLVREYEGTVPIHHVDVYRLERLQDVLDLGFEEMLEGEAVVFVEWGDAIEALLPQDHLDVEIDIPNGEEGRAITVGAAGGAWTRRWPLVAAALAPWSEDEVRSEGAP